nr:PAS domain-containing protein [Thermosphaera aggregans]
MGRRLEYCHPPRLEQYVARNVEALKTGREKYKVFWTRLGDRIIRVLLVAVRKPDGELLGVAEIVEDFTEVLNNPGEVFKKIVVL